MSKQHTGLDTCCYGCAEANLAKARESATAAHLRAQLEAERAEMDNLALAIGYGERPEGQGHVIRASGEVIAARWRERERELDTERAKVEKLREALEQARREILLRPLPIAETYDGFRISMAVSNHSNQLSERIRDTLRETAPSAKETADIGGGAQHAESAQGGRGAVSVPSVAVAPDSSNSHQSLRVKVDKLTAAIDWALGGEGSDFRPRREGEGQYYWRKELQAKRDAALRETAPSETPRDLDWHLEPEEINPDYAKRRALAERVRERLAQVLEAEARECAARGDTVNGAYEATFSEAAGMIRSEDLTPLLEEVDSPAVAARDGAEPEEPAEG